MVSDPGVFCPLCGADTPLHCEAWGRSVHRCPTCELHFVPAVYWLTPEEEIARYQLHCNRIDDAGYVRFLSPVIDCLKRHGVRGRVLDYGAGPAPVLMELLVRAGFEAKGYDPYFGGQDGQRWGALGTSDGFDAVVSTEVFEHFREPAREMDRIVSLLNPGGLLVALTALVTEEVDMATWHYVNDSTHIVFYTEATFRHIARRWRFQLVECVGNRLVALQRTR